MEEQMNFSYDETDDFDEEDDVDDETQDSYMEEDDSDVVDLEEDLDDQATALSRAFREAAAADGVEEEDEDEDEDKEIEAVAEPEDEKEDTTEEADDNDADDNDTEAYEQRLAEAIDALPDDEDLEVVLPPLELPPLEIEPFRPQEQSNYAYADAMTAYYEEKDYQRAIEKFGEAIENEAQGTAENLTDANEVIAKAMYWQAEAYVKMEDVSQAIGTFKDLIQTCQAHYLSLAAQRRADQLNLKNP